MLHLFRNSLFFLTLLLPTFFQSYAWAQVSFEVTADAETDPVSNDGDSADDIAIWVHPTQPELSVIIGTNKASNGGLSVYNLDGDELQFVSAGRINNVDIRSGFSFNDEAITIVAATNRSNDRVELYTFDTTTRSLSETTVGSLDPTYEPYGICLYRSPLTGKFFAFVTARQENRVTQWEIFDNDLGAISGTNVREIETTGLSEGCVADDEARTFYLSEENIALWKYGAESSSGLTRTLVDQVTPNGNLSADIEGVAIYYTSNGKGYLVASSQGSDSYNIYRREEENEYLGSFQIIDGSSIDRTTVTDGIDLVSANLGSNFPNGIFVAQDNANPGANQNFKIVSWEKIAAGLNDNLSNENTIYFQWNTFLGIQNFIELLNPSANPTQASVRLYNSSGNQIYAGSISLEAFQQFDISINGLGGIMADEIGFGEVVSTNNNIQGQVFSYRFSETAEEFDFVRNTKLSSSTQATQYLTFNTFNPNSGSPVNNWLTLINLDSTHNRSFLVNLYDLAGTLVRTQTVIISPNSRVDVQAGHESPGANQAGLIEINPNNTQSPYLASIVRYGVGTLQTNDFAMALSSSSGASGNQWVPISSGGAAANWLVLSNTSDSSIDASVSYFNNAGNLLGTDDVTLPAHAQHHVPAHSIIVDRTSGIAKIETAAGELIRAESIYYFFNATTREVSTSYGILAQSSFPGTSYSNYNLYIGNSNFLKLFNIAESSSLVSLVAYKQDGSSSSHSFTLAPLTGAEFDLSALGLEISPNSYGVLGVISSSNNQILQGVLRVNLDSDNVTIGTAKFILGR